MRLTLLLLLAGASGCGAPEQAEDEIPTDVQAWLAADGHGQWEAESQVFATSEFGAARVYVNGALAASLASGDARHPRGAAAVRELYAADGVTLTGFALAHRGGDEPSADGWRFYETYELTSDGTPQTDAYGAPTCVGCHIQGSDFVRTKWPLR